MIDEEILKQAISNSLDLVFTQFQIFVGYSLFMVFGGVIIGWLFTRISASIKISNLEFQLSEKDRKVKQHCDDVITWCNYNHPEAAFTAKHILGHMQGGICNAGSPVRDELCVISGFRTQLEKRLYLPKVDNTFVLGVGRRM